MQWGLEDKSKRAQCTWRKRGSEEGSYVSVTADTVPLVCHSFQLGGDALDVSPKLLGTCAKRLGTCHSLVRNLETLLYATNIRVKDMTNNKKNKRSKQGLCLHANIYNTYLDAYNLALIQAGGVFQLGRHLVKLCLHGAVVRLRLLQLRLHAHVPPAHVLKFTAERALGRRRPFKQLCMLAQGTCQAIVVAMQRLQLSLALVQQRLKLALVPLHALAVCPQRLHVPFPRADVIHALALSISKLATLVLQRDLTVLELSTQLLNTLRLRLARGSHVAHLRGERGNLALGVGKGRAQLLHACKLLVCLHHGRTEALNVVLESLYDALLVRNRVEMTCNDVILVLCNLLVHLDNPFKVPHLGLQAPVMGRRVRKLGIARGEAAAQRLDVILAARQLHLVLLPRLMQLPLQPTCLVLGIAQSRLKLLQLVVPVRHVLGRTLCIALRIAHRAEQRLVGSLELADTLLRIFKASSSGQRSLER